MGTPLQKKEEMSDEPDGPSVLNEPESWLTKLSQRGCGQGAIQWEEVEKYVARDMKDQTLMAVVVLNTMKHFNVFTKSFVKNLVQKFRMKFMHKCHTCDNYFQAVGKLKYHLIHSCAFANLQEEKSKVEMTARVLCERTEGESISDFGDDKLLTLSELFLKVAYLEHFNRNRK